MANLPDEITMIILSNLPVKSLLRFKCVSKSWGTWISSPNFQLSNQRQEGVIVVTRSTSRSRRSKCSTLIRFIYQQLASEELNYPRMKTDHTQYFWLLGSCHGLLLIHVREHIYLWNPVTRFCTKVLELDRLNDDGYYIRGGLCFDSSKKIYKAVLIMQHQTPDYGGEFVIVASLKDKQWRLLEFPSDILSMSTAITFQGRLHYRVKVKTSDNDENRKFREGIWDRFASFNQVIYLDPISEKFDMFPVPEPKSNQEENVIVGLGVLNECLCMTRLEDDKGGVEILVMKEYGVKESWTFLFFIRNLEINPSYDSAEPFSVTKIGEVALIIEVHFHKKVVVYNPKNDNIRDILVVDRKTEYLCGPMLTYVESLISREDYYWSENRHKQFGKLIWNRRF